MEVKRKMSEMKNADVRFISLVHRAANRIPFRVVKHEESTMGIDLTSIRRLASKADTKPQITGLVIFKQEDAGLKASIENILKTEGFAIDSATENEDGTVLYAQAPAAATSTLIRLSDNLAVVVKGFEKQAEVMADAAGFSPVVPAEGFFHGPRIAAEAFAAASVETVAKGESIEDLSKQYQAYVGAMAALPAAVFKADALLEEILKGKGKGHAKAMANADAKDPEGSAAEEASETPAQEAAEEAAGEKPDADDKAKAKKDEVTDIKTNAGSAGDDDTQRDKASQATERTGVDQDPALKADPMAAVLEAIKGLGEQVAALKSEVADNAKNFREELENVSRKSEDASKAVKQTVIAATKADAEPAQKVKTEKADPRTGCFDSATFRRR